MDLSIPYTSQCLTFLTPEALTDNSWKTLILPFSTAMWACVLFFLFCVGTLFYVFEHVNAWIHRSKSKCDSNQSQPKVIFLNHNTKSFLQTKRPKKKKYQGKDIFDSFGDCILLTYSMLLVVSLPRLPRSWPIRLLTGWYVRVHVQCSLFSYLTFSGTYLQVLGLLHFTRCRLSGQFNSYTSESSTTCNN